MYCNLVIFKLSYYSINNRFKTIGKDWKKKVCVRADLGVL